MFFTPPTASRRVRRSRFPVAKIKGANATDVANAVTERVERIRGELLPEEVTVAVTRDYGETAKEKSDELILHLIVATVSVVILMAIFLGFRASLIVGVAVPVTLALTLLIYYLWGYTLNRVTLFALIFSIGILVDDAIVVVENIHRHSTDEEAPAAAGGGVRRGRGGQPDDPGHLHGDLGHPADGIRLRPDGPLHAADPRRGVLRHGDDLAARRLHRLAVDRLPLAAEPRWRGRRRHPNWSKPKAFTREPTAG